MKKHVVLFEPGKIPVIVSHSDTCIKSSCPIETAIESIVSRRVYLSLRGKYEIFPNEHRHGTYVVREFTEYEKVGSCGN